MPVNFFRRVLAKKIPLRTAWYGLIIMASMLPAAALSPWLYQQAHTLLLDRAMLSERMFHQAIAMRLQLETERLISVLRNKADPIAYFVSQHRDIDFMRKLVKKINQREPLLNTTTIYDRHANLLLSAHHGEHMPAVIDSAAPAFVIPMQKRVFIGSPVRLSDKHLEILIAVPLIADNESIGVMISTVNIDVLWRSVSAQAPEHNSKIYLVDDRGSMLTPPPGSTYQQGALLSDRKIVRALLMGRDWYRPDAFEGLDGEKVFGIATLVRNLRWGVISEIPAASIASPITSILITLTLIVVILHVLFGMISLMFTKRLLNPVSELAKVVKCATQGDYEHTLRPSRYREIDDLNVSFSTMIHEIEKREFSLHQITATAHDAFIQMNADGIITSWNPEAEKIFGWKSEQVIGRVLGDTIVPPEYRSAHVQGLKQFLASGKEGIIANKTVEITGMHFDEHIFPIELSVVPVHTGVTWTFNAFIRDTSVRKQAELQLRKLSSLIEKTGEGVVVTDRDGTIEYVNPAFTRLTGYSPEEAMGQNPRILNSGNQDAAFYKNMWDTILSGKIWRKKVIDRKKDGTFYPVILTISPIRNGAGEITHFAATHADMTEHDEMQAKFEQSQKMESIGTMVGGIAHNFNNMLAAITGNIYLAKKQVRENKKALEHLDVIEKSSFRAADMINQLLAFARKGMINMKEMPLTPFIRETLKFLRTSVPENIMMHENICGDELLIRGDATQIHQILMNLINNARDAVAGVDEPCITTWLEVLHADDAFLEGRPYFSAGDYAHLSVEDNGCGISEGQMKKVFEPFFTTKEVGKGTGLGLSMVYGTMKTHHGFTEVESIQGEGATFHVYIPLLKSKEPVSEPVKSGEISESGRGELILLADDAQDIREIMGEVLESFGYRVIQAKDGLEAMELFRARREEIALAILDVVMPHLGGMQLAKCLREINPGIPVIFMTGYDRQQVVDGREELGNSDILTKPAQFDALSRSIRKLLRSRQ